MTEVKLDFDKQGGLVPVIVTDYKTGQVLMLAYMNEVSYQLTLETKQMHYWSRSRNELWHKGATSGHFQHVKSIKTDCDQDTSAYRCGTRRSSLSYRSLQLFLYGYI